MFIRFITQFKNEFDEYETGVFNAAHFLHLSEQTHDYDKNLLLEIRDWFSANLDRPTRFNKSKRRNAQGVSLSWFKSSASEHLKRMYDLKALLERYDIVVDVIKNRKPWIYSL